MKNLIVNGKEERITSQKTGKTCKALGAGRVLIILNFK
jgi:hypothetical protein